MKKLLSLLSVLTISGTAVPTTIAASPYQKEETIKNSEINYSQTNNLENLIRKKRWSWPWSSKNFNLNVSTVRQSLPYWCGPSAGEAVLRYFGLSSVPFNGSFLSSIDYQRILSINMNTNIDAGTDPYNWINAVNNLIRNNNLNNNRQYSIQTIDRNYNDRNILDIIGVSLENNTPVALAYRGILPNRFNLHNNNIENHFIIINGVNISSQMITYIDPGTGQTGEFSINAFWLLASMTNQSSYLISYNPNVNVQNQIQNPNNTEQMEIGDQNHYISQTGIDFCINIRSKREVIEIWAVPFKGHKVKLSLNYENWKNILLISSYKNKQDFKNQTICFLNNIQYNYESRALEGYPLSDYKSTYIDILSEVIWDHWSDIGSKLQNLNINKRMIITTWGDKTWHGENSIEIKDKY